jgi:putative glutamine amidotransferase
VTPDPRAATCPRIGLTCYRERAAFGSWDERADLLPASYADAIAQAGGAPLLLPPGAPDLEAAASSVLAGVHGLVLTGGPDIDPARYQTGREAHTNAPRPDRDSWEITLTRAAIAGQLPVLGVCRGMQLLNVALGGDLWQHLPTSLGHDGHCPAVGVHGRHVVRLDPAARPGSVLGVCADVATYHHQAVHRLGDGLVATGWTDDGTIEAIEAAGRGWVVGVQWHPEVHDGQRLFADFVAACASRRDDLNAARH